MIYVKEGVDIANMTGPIWSACTEVDAVLDRYGIHVTVITSYRDNNPEDPHIPTSKHFVGNAVDIRNRAWRHQPDLSRSIIQSITAALGSPYQVTDEGDHIHVEFDPPRVP